MFADKYENADEMARDLNIPVERAERAFHLGDKLEGGSISKSELYELCSIVLIPREREANDKVQHGILPYVKLKHLGGEVSVNDIIRATFSTVNDKSDVIEASQAAKQDGSIVLTSNLVMMHPDDVVQTEDGFDVQPQTYQSDEDESTTEPAKAEKSVDLNAVF